MAAPTKAARNDRRRLTATFLNTIAVAFVVTGVIVPVISLTYQLTTPQTRYWPVFGLAWLTFGIGLHLIARHILNGVEE